MTTPERHRGGAAGGAPGPAPALAQPDSAAPLPWLRPLRRLEARLQPGGWGLVKATAQRWSNHDAPRLGASLAFYSMLSLAPLMVLVVAIVGLVFGENVAAVQVADQVRDMVGDQGADAIQALIWNARTSPASTFASVLGIATLLFGASSVFAELRAILNLVWEADRPPGGASVIEMLRHRFFSFGMVLAVGFLLIVSLTISAALAAAGKYFTQWLPVPPEVLDAINFLVSFVVTTGAYGAAGSLIVVIVWVYYSAQIFIFGAEFTHVFAHAHGSRCPQARAREATSAGGRA